MAVQGAPATQQELGTLRAQVEGLQAELTAARSELTAARAEVQPACSLHGTSLPSTFPAHWQASRCLAVPSCFAGVVE